MNRNTAALIHDLINAHVISTRPACTRTGIVARTDMTEKMEIVGLPCHVEWENEHEARVIVYTDETETRRHGVYILSPSEVLS